MRRRMDATRPVEIDWEQAAGMALCIIFVILGYWIGGR